MRATPNDDDGGRPPRGLRPRSSSSLAMATAPSLSSFEAPRAWQSMTESRVWRLVLTAAAAAAAKTTTKP